MRDGKYVILYVDDDPDMLDSLRMVLEGSGYLMEEAMSAEDGLHRYKAVKPDFVIVDLMMEEVDAGAHLAKELKALHNTKPVYLLSSVGDQLHQTIDSVALGLTGVFQKPVSFDTLLATLRSKLK
jgi:DNA-binding response OmpR family regulator